MAAAVRSRTLAGLGLLLLVALPVAAEEKVPLPVPPWQIAADRIEHQKRPDRVVAEGEVVLSREEADAPAMTMTADWLQYDLESERVTARGNLHLAAGEDQLFASQAELDVVRQTGTLTDTTLVLSRHDMRLTGSRVERTGPDTYHFTDAWVSACPVQGGRPPAWSLSSQEIDLTVDGYALLEDAYLSVLDVPVFYLPYLILPAKTTRQTGLLFPEFSQSDRDGTGLLVPLFVDLGPSLDFTLYPGYLGRRGPLAGIEARYALDAFSLGTFDLNLLADRTADRAGDEYKGDGYLRTREGRYWLRGKIDQDLGAGFFGRVDLDSVSDRDFLDEFRKGMKGFDRSEQDYLEAFGRGFQERTIPFRESTVQVTRLWPGTSLGAEIRTVDDETGLLGPTTAIQTLPRVAMAGLVPIEGLAVPLSLDWTSEYVHYWRATGLGDQRLELAPRLGAVLPAGPYLEAAAFAGVRQSLYHVLPHGEAARQAWTSERLTGRTVPELEASLATTLMRDFHPDWEGAPRLTHLVRPEIGWRYRPNADQAELPALDAHDRLQGRSLFAYGVRNALWPDGDTLSWLRPGGWLAVRQAYDLLEAERAILIPGDETRPFSDVSFELEVSPWQPLVLSYDTALSVYGEGIVRYDLGTRFTSERGERLSLDYRYSRVPGGFDPSFFTDRLDKSVHDVNLALDLNLTPQVGAQYALSQSFSNDSTVDSSVRLIYRPGCWTAELLASRTSEDQRVAVIVSLAGIGRMLELGLPEL
ncbi:MAG: LPS assembly protein LptD [Thermodesulfobacteriota bacterium]